MTSALPAAAALRPVSRGGVDHLRVLASVLGAVLAAVLAVVLAGVLAVGVSARPAAAHDALSGSTPADGSTVDVPPASVDLTFGEPPLELGSEVRVTGPDGRVVNGGDLVLAGTTVSQPLAPDLPAGTYAVAWRVTSSDGHPISGELSFTATAGNAPTGDPTGDATAGPTPDPTEGAAQEPAPTETLSATPPEPAPDAQAGAGSSSGATPWLLVAAVLLAGAAAAWWARRRSGGAGPPAPRSPRDRPSAGS